MVIGQLCVDVHQLLLDRKHVGVTFDLAPVQGVLVGRQLIEIAVGGLDLVDDGAGRPAGIGFAENPVDAAADAQ